ncbi:MAG: energy transducer TonB [Bacteroidia bacterium]
MKTPIILFLVFVSSFCFRNVASAQDSTAKDTTTIIETLPEFPGGEAELIAYLIDNVEYPKKEKRKGMQGTAYVRFVIDETGKVRDVDIFPGTEDRATEAMKAEAIRVVSEMPAWKPGTQKGKPVSVQYSIPIMFKFK